MKKKQNISSSPEVLVNNFGLYDAKLDLENYKYPTSDLLPEALRPLLYKQRELVTEYKMPLLLNSTENLVVKDLYHAPNVLIAGTIASGKSQFIYNQLIYWLYIFHPSKLKLVICRSKPVDYNSIARLENHFLAKPKSQLSPISEDREASVAIRSLLLECDRRLNLFQNAGVKNIEDYNIKFIRRELNIDNGHQYLTNIVLVLDDLATFLSQDTNRDLIALTQKNLYTGIYAIAATGQIMAYTIGPQLRANFSVRLAMKLMSQNESKRILEHIGAEKLINPGELLYESHNRLLKGEQPFIPYDVIQSVCEFIESQKGYPSAMLLHEYFQDVATDQKDLDIDSLDPLFEDAARLVVMHQQGSTSFIQRKLKLGYNRTGRIIDQLEDAGIVGPFEGSKAREILIPDEYALEQFLDNIKGFEHKQTIVIQEKSKIITAEKQKDTSEEEKTLGKIDLSSVDCKSNLNEIKIATSLIPKDLYTSKHKNSVWQSIKNLFSK